MSRSNRDQASAWLSPLWVALHVAALVGFGVTQPLLDLIGRNPGFLAAHALHGQGLVAFALAAAFLPSMGAGAFLWLLVTWTSDRGLGRVVGALGIFTAGAVAALSFTARYFTGAFAALGLAALAGCALLALYRRLRGVRLFVGALLPVLVIAPIAFLGRGPVRQKLKRVELPPASPVARPQPVVFLVLDELPAAVLMTPDFEIDRVRFPNFAELASTSDHFPFAYAPANWTQQAIPAILSGRYVSRGEEEEVSRRCVFLSQLTSSYDVRVTEKVTDLVPSSTRTVAQTDDRSASATLLGDLVVVLSHRLLPAQLRKSLPPIDVGWAGFLPSSGKKEALAETDPNAPSSATPSFRALLESLGSAADEPTFFFHHELLPHQPWYLLPSGQSYDRRRWPPLRPEDVWSDDWATLEARARLELQVGAVDRLLGLLMGRLHSTGRWRDTWFIVLADHGLSFETGFPMRSLEPALLAAAELPVPLLVKRPGQSEGKRIDRYVETIDVAATLAAELGFELPCEGSSRPLYGAEERSFEESVLAQAFGFERTDFPGAEVPGSEFAALRQAVSDESRRHRERLRLDDTPELAALPLTDAPFALGPYGQLVGKPVPDAAAELPWTVELEYPKLFAAVEPGAAEVPARVVGRLRGLKSAATPYLGLALGDKIVSTTRVRWVDSDPVFAALVSPQRLVPGRQTFTYFTIEGSPENPVLRRLHTGERQERLQSSFEAAGALLLQGGPRGFDLLVQTNGVDGTDEGNGVLRFEATNADPYLVFSLEGAQATTDMVIALELVVPRETDCQVWLTTYDDPNFKAVRESRRKLHAGFQQVLVEVSANSPIRTLRVDPGTVPGRYELRRLEGRAVGDATADSSSLGPSSSAE